MVRAFQVCFLLFFAIPAFSQTQDPAVVTFTLDFPSSSPEHYSFRVQSDGPAHYESSGRISPDSDEKDTFALDFTTSPATRQQIFRLAAKAGYFQKDLDSRHKGLAFTGRKTLSYKDSKHSGESTFNYSSQPAAQELTSLFQNLAATLEFGRRLQYDHRYQKLALDAEIRQMEEGSGGSSLPELSAIAPILRQIISDSSVMNITRARAQQLLERAGLH